MEKVQVIQGTVTKLRTPRVAALMVKHYGWAYVDAIVVPKKEELVSEVKQALRESDSVEWLEAQIALEKEGLNRTQVIKTAEKRILQLNTGE